LAIQARFSPKPADVTIGLEVPYVQTGVSQLAILYPAIKKSTGFIFRGGHAERNHPACGQFRHELVCPSCGHKEILKYSCHELSCPECSDTWITRTATRSAERFNACLAIYRIPAYHVKHVTFSPPQEWAIGILDSQGKEGLSILRHEFNKVLKKAGAKGALSIFHACRKEHGQWVLSPHFHVLLVGYLQSSDSFFAQTGWVYKAIPNRGKRNAYATVSYQLSHVFYYGDLATGERIGNYHVLSWHGNFSYNKVMVDCVTYKLEPYSCPECGDAMEELFDYVDHRWTDLFYVRRKYVRYKRKGSSVG